MQRFCVLFKVTHLSVAKKVFEATCLDIYTKSYFQCYNFYRRLSIFSAHCKLIAATTTAPLLQTQRNAQVHWYSNLQELNLGIKGAEWWQLSRIPIQNRRGTNNFYGRLRHTHSEKEKGRILHSIVEWWDNLYLGDHTGIASMELPQPRVQSSAL